ncbi:MAG: RDD family protein [Fimbriimonadaceae bacterium]|nr:RDD family protein [Fimbriimonadaceae bacterium]
MVLTPEKVVVWYRHAGHAARIGAHLIDLLIVLLANIAIGLILSFTLAALSPGLYSLVLGLVIAFGIFAYFIICEGAFQGVTLGKRAFRLRVMQVDGTPINWRSAFLRNILRVADMLPGFYGVGFVTMFLNERSQRLGDLISGTVVVVDSELPQGFAPAPHRVGIHPLEYSVGELGSMTLAEYQAIKKLCDRFPYLPVDEQRRSLAQIWEPFREKQSISPVPNVHPIYQMEAVVMKFGRMKKLV